MSSATSTRSTLPAYALWALRLLALIAALAVGMAGPAAADPGDESGVSRAALPPTDPGLWWIKNNGLPLQDNAVAGVRLTQLPAGANPVFFGVLWHFTPVPGKVNTYFVENHNAGCLDIADGISTNPGVLIEVRQCDGTLSQQWVTPHHGGVRYGMTNVWSGLAATVKGAAVPNAKLHQQPVNGSAAQSFDMPSFDS
ncbi:RICIN domain-containing protein [Nonomuraea sp. SYSU D8015]|uniref:RICIN domain-containing protein n=1 Tax=Nonomuraea sp. SYSU D8015 TaxID=2593644 RepID=UPI001660E9F4|nr:RICIN domain-containing protein [Nonomuraea sp. SYSU D8015]